ncbi:hypothetical protein SIN8267_03262 [Sinobacterium norvegicum]|uniref:Chalcone isomerase domain-containing protein n=1 Tax=Sinobacterium norvegicum TaxID=1641715 RepID=A0ABM9AIR6_9GAMM|nr:chalcone isomerase family protein [Sinobacterium norvegicum]CAH0993123.1 hypothetical protein SIN8267_03262 [Sinobacterium norvegicum]
MKKTLSTLLLTATLTAASLSTPALAGDKLPAQLTVAGTELKQIGDGTRKKLFIKLYNAAFYGEDKDFTADKPMAIQLEITSGLIDSKKLSSATADGFDAVTNGDTSAIDDKIKQLLDALSAPVNEGDILDFSYSDNNVAVSQNGKLLTTIEGKDFKNVFFSIWLGEQGIDEDLREDMLDL